MEDSDAVLKKVLRKKMPKKVFDISSSSHDNGNKIDTSIFVQRH